MKSTQNGLGPKSNDYIPTLDGWRAIAILGVLVCHGFTPLFREGGPLANRKLFALSALGSYGVPIFFAISGYLITSKLLFELRSTGTISFKNFYLRRIFRILPASLTYIAVVALLSAINIFPLEQEALVASLLFFKNLSPDSTWYLSHFWSLSNEEQYYFYWPLLMKLSKTKALIPISLIVCGVSLWFQTTDNPALKGIKFDGIIWGCLLGLMMGTPRVARFLTKVLKPRYWLALLPLVGLGILGKIPLGLYWLSPAIALLILGTVLHPVSPMAKILEAGPLRTIGKWSYSIYLWQQLFCVMDYRVNPFGIFQTFPLNIMASICLAYMSYRFIETPFIQLGHRLTSGSNGSVEEKKHGSGEREAA